VPDIQYSLCYYLVPMLWHYHCEIIERLFLELQ
jgi:hypothetical protein